MRPHQKALLNLLSSESNFNLSSLESYDLSSLFVDTAFVATALQFITEENWIQNQQKNEEITSFKNFILPFLKKELSPLLYMQDFWKTSSIEEVKFLEKRILSIKKSVIRAVQSRDFYEQKIFAISALKTMDTFFELEENLENEKKSQGLMPRLSLYRTFDDFDLILNLDYTNDQEMKQNTQDKERIYAGAGVGVQSGYSTVLTALRYIKPAVGARIVDLGSGYGRVGFVIGLLRPDMNFKGYEYVQHRVDVTFSSCYNLNLQSHVQFYAQDLSMPDFFIPDAEIYYMYDPFTDLSYAHILEQLVKISHRQPISIVTKGDAKDWMIKVMRQEHWKVPIELDGGNLCIFQS